MQFSSWELIKKMSVRRGFSYWGTLFGPIICGVSYYEVKYCRNSSTSLFPQYSKDLN